MQLVTQKGMPLPCTAEPYYTSGHNHYWHTGDAQFYILELENAQDRGNDSARQKAGGSKILERRLRQNSSDYVALDRE